MDYSNIIWQRKGNIGIITFNNPDSYNSLSAEMETELMDLLPRLNGEKDLHAVILTGAGKAFGAGGDMQRFLNGARNRREQGGVGFIFSNRLARALLAVEIPLIAAINGAAVGAGLTISLTCDLRIASEHGLFGAVFSKVGIAPEFASSFLLSRIVGVTKANEMALTAKIIDAKEALTAGLISEITSPEDLLPRAEELAGQIADLPAFGIRVTKRVLRHGMSATMEQALDYEEHAETLCLSTLDHEEAIKAFIEKRQPIFIGR